MEKQTRVSKYKDLRDEIKEEAGINQVYEEQPVEDDDFLAFLPKKEKPKIDDTLLEPLSYETLDDDSEEIKHALNEAKINVGKEQYNTRLDILNKIRQEDQPQPTVEEESPTSQESGKKMSLLERLATMSPQEDVEELEKYEEELHRQEENHKKEEETIVEEPVVEETIVEKQPETVDELEVEEDDDDKEGKLITVLNYVIILFIIILIVLLFFIAKQILF